MTKRQRSTIDWTTKTRFRHISKLPEVPASALRNYDAAEKLVKNISKKNPENTAYAVDLGFVYESKGDINKAKQTYDKTIKSLQPDQGQIMNLANAFFSHQNWDYALATYTEGKKLMRNIYSFNFETAEVYFQKQEYEKMIDEYLNAVAENQVYLQSVQNILQSRIGNDPDNSRSTLLRQALLRRTQRDPDQSIFSEMLIWLFVQQKDFESAFIQAKALDKRLREDGSRVMNIGSMSEANLDDLRQSIATSMLLIKEKYFKLYTCKNAIA